MNQTLKIWTDLTRIGLESQMVIGLRTAGMMGLVDSPKGETGRMILEKQQAASAALRAMTRAAMQGRSAEKIVEAGLQPYRRRTTSNAKRLTRAAMI